MKKFFTLLLFATVCLALNAGAQTVYRSAVTGNWGAFGSWEISTDNGVSFNPTVSGQTPGAGNDVTVRTPHVITVDASGKNAKLITIVSGATLRAGSNTSERTLRINGATFLNDGALGGTNDALTLELNTANAVGGFTLTGAGTAALSRIRMVGGNLNNGGANTLTINQNVTCLVGTNGISQNYALNVNGAAGSDDYTMTIAAGKTVTVAGGYLNSSGSSGGASVAFGNYTYNINGVLDMSASTTTGNSTFIASADASKVFTVNINGAFRLPTSGNSSLALHESAATGQLGTLLFNINDGGLLDASIAPINTSYSTIGPRYFRISGSGRLKRTVNASDVLFAVGTTTSYSPATLNNAGTVDDYSLNVKGTIDNAAPTPLVVNRQWNITDSVAGGSDLTIKLGWLATDQAPGFDPAGTVVIMRYNGSGYTSFPAVVSGAGTEASPYVATASGITVTGAFIIANDVAAVPVKYISNRAYAKYSGVQVEWTTAGETDVNSFVVEKSVDGRNFIAAGTIAAQAGNATKNYTWYDANPNMGVNFYRIRTVETIGAAKYTAVMKVNLNSPDAEMIIGGNPVQAGSLSLQLNGLAKGNYTLSVVNNAGQVIYTKSIPIETVSLSQSTILPVIHSGMYIVQLRGNNTNLTRKIIVQ